MRTAREAAHDDPPSSVFLAAALVYAAGFFWLAAFRLPPGPASPGGYLVLVFFALFLALAHGALTALAARFVARLPGLASRPASSDLLAALGLATLYSWLGLSLGKFTFARSHLRVEDLWFVFGSLRQVGAEGSSEERAILLATLLAPVALTALFYAGLRGARRRSSASRAPAGALVRLAVVALAALALLCWRYPYARFVAGTQAPETSFLARQWGGATAVGRLAGNAPALVFTPDPNRSARIGSVAPAPPAALARRDNVVILMLESVPWSRLFGPLARPEATPRMNALAAESIVFARAYASATHSDYAQTSILAALHPRKFDRHDYFIDLAYPRTLIWDLLRPAGYRTALFSCQNEGWGNMQAFLRTPGLELFRHSPDWPAAPRRGDGAESKVFETTPVTAFRDWLAGTKDGPFLAYLNFQATHYPYVIPPGATPLYEPSTIDFPTTFLSYPAAKIPVMENRFYNALQTVDAAVGGVVEALRAAGVWERTILLVVSDHGEAFYEHGVPTHGTTLLEEQIRTAAFLRLPGPGPDSAPRVVGEPVSVLDLVPAVAHYLGLPPHGNFQGRYDILDPGYRAQGRPFLFTIQGITQEDGLLLDDWKLLENRDRRELALFDLARDPGERRNLAGSEPARRGALEQRLDALLAEQLAYYRDRGWESGWYPPRLP